MEPVENPSSPLLLPSDDALEGQAALPNDGRAEVMEAGTKQTTIPPTMSTDFLFFELITSVIIFGVFFTYRCVFLHYFET